MIKLLSKKQIPEDSFEINVNLHLQMRIKVNVKVLHESKINEIKFKILK
jgi:hypothetical protein